MIQWSKIFNYLLLALFWQSPDGCFGLCNSFQDVLCKSYCEKIGTQAKLQDGRFLSCSVKPASSDSEIPRSKKWDKTAVSPASSTISCYNWYFERLKKYKPALNITWTQSEQNIRDEFVEGYLITQDVSFYKVSLHVEGKPSALKHIKKHECINFSFNCFGTKMELFQYNERLAFTIISLPMSQKDDRSFNEISYDYTIPASDKCGASIEGTTSVAASEQSPKKDNKDRYLTIGISIFIIICLCAVIWLCKQCQKKRKEIWKKDQKIQHIFMIADTNEDCEIWHTIAQKIKDSLHIKVETNWENSKMKYNNLVDWYTKIFQNTDAVIILDGIRTLKILDMNIEMHVAEKNEFETLIQYYLQMSESATKRTIFLMSEKEEEKYLVKRKRKNWKAFLMGNENFPESFYQYLQKYSLPVKMKSLSGKNEVNQNRTNRKDEVKRTYATSMV